MNFIRITLNDKTRWALNQRNAQVEARRLVVDEIKSFGPPSDYERMYDLYARHVKLKPMNIPTNRKEMLAWLRENIK